MCEQLLRQFICQFDGARKDFSEVEYLFELLFDKNFVMTSKHGIRSNISDMKRMFKSDLEEKRTTYMIQSCRRICIGTIEAEIRISNDEIDKIEHIVCSFEGEKLVRAHITNEFDTRKYFYDMDMFNLVERFKLPLFDTSWEEVDDI